VTIKVEISLEVPDEIADEASGIAGRHVNAARSEIAALAQQRGLQMAQGPRDGSGKPCASCGQK